MRSFLARPAARIAGTTEVPGDKSISHRALMLAGIAEGPSRIRGFLAGEDCLATLAALRSLGVPIEQPASTEVRVRGVGLHGLEAPRSPLDMGNAGTAMRLFAGLLAGQAFSSELIGDASLMRRPMERVAQPLRAMGADIRTEDGRPPLRISGGRALHGIRYAMPVASAQVKSALLLAGLYADGETTVIAPAVSRDHSERMLEGCGVRIQREALITTLTPPERLAPLDLEVPGDFSSAAFFIVAALLAADGEGIVLENVGVNPTRTGLLEILRRMGARIEVRHERLAGGEPVASLHVRRAPLQGIVVPAELVPLAIDEFPALFVAAACARGTTVVSGAEELRVKESDRLATMSAGLEALGVPHRARPDGLEIEGRPEGAAFRGSEVDSRGDHRVAMSFAVASLRAAAPIRIRDVANVATSFPGFVERARSLGLDLIEQTDPA
ncbi:MAG TPA: 3-phosphoshikimate 1-carboxyvinyltransferase [Steroidobacteraceae bacterium]|nr:3-phosphoshikimate 1-carboxyvinyltransferase [Steroidobacteraceae bacterium]